MKKGDLIIHKNSGKTGTVTSHVFAKLYRDASDWEACAAGYDSGYAASALRVFWHATGQERVHKYSKLSKYYSVVEYSNNEETNEFAKHEK